MSERVKILLTIPNFKTAGSQYVLQNLYRQINREIFDLYVGIENLPEYFPEEIPASQRIFFKRSGKKISDIRTLRNILRKNRIDLVHSWDHKSDFTEAVACRLANVKYLYTKKNNAWSKRWKLKSFLSDHIAYDNPEMKNRFFNSFLFRGKITFIPHGVDPDIFVPSLTLRSGKIPFNLCCVGNIVPNKNQLFLVESLLRLPEYIQLHLAGRADAKYLENLKKFVQEKALEKRVHFHSFIGNNSLPEFFKDKDVFVLASYNEGLPVSVLEAMACGLPVISSCSGGGTAFILKDGKGGYLFGDREDFLQQVLKLRQEEVYEEKSRQAVENVRQNFKLKDEIRSYEVLYKKLIKK
ncbi:glycosyltransferase family 4 protein [Candidatus Micrarchaeota archaeon]|nr:glycosyltransferase family 4 protein [Candidatus Micrarchaeota archaeon]